MIDDVFQSTLSVRRATYRAMLNTSRIKISIHALRKESDLLNTRFGKYLKISIHALRKESDPSSNRFVRRVF